MSEYIFTLDPVRGGGVSVFTDTTTTISITIASITAHNTRDTATTLKKEKNVHNLKILRLVRHK